MQQLHIEVELNTKEIVFSLNPHAQECQCGEGRIWQHERQDVKWVMHLNVILICILYCTLQNNTICAYLLVHMHSTCIYFTLNEVFTLKYRGNINLYFVLWSRITVGYIFAYFWEMLLNVIYIMNEYMHAWTVLILL